MDVAGVGDRDAQACRRRARYGIGDDALEHVQRRSPAPPPGRRPRPARSTSGSSWRARERAGDAFAAGATPSSTSACASGPLAGAARARAPRRSGGTSPVAASRSTTSSVDGSTASRVRRRSRRAPPAAPAGRRSQGRAFESISLDRGIGTRAAALETRPASITMSVRYASRSGSPAKSATSAAEREERARTGSPSCGRLRPCRASRSTRGHERGEHADHQRDRRRCGRASRRAAARA